MDGMKLPGDAPCPSTAFSSLDFRPTSLLHHHHSTNNQSGDIISVETGHELDMPVDATDALLLPLCRATTVVRLP